MRITKLEAIPVRVPLKAGMVTKTAHGDHHTSDYVIVKLHTDDGIVGLGEATVSALWSGETSKSCVATLADLIGPALMGADPTQISGGSRKLMDFLIKLNPFTKAAVEMAAVGYRRQSTRGAGFLELLEWASSGILSRPR